MWYQQVVLHIMHNKHGKYYKGNFLSINVEKFMIDSFFNLDAA